MCKFIIACLISLSALSFSSCTQKKVATSVAYMDFPHLFGVDDIDLVIDYIEHLRPDLVLERFVSQSPKELLIAPDWGLKNYEFNHRVQKRMKELGAYQGKKYEM